MALLTAIAAILSLRLSLNSSSNKSSTTTWKIAKDTVAAPLLKKVLSSASTLQIDEKSVKVMQIPSQGAGNIFVFDFHSPQLCGTAGCLYQVYHESGRLLLSVMANRNLPPNEELIRVSSSTYQAFPCLVLTQITEMENMVSRNDYCFNSGEYTRMNETWTAVGADFLPNGN
jgi:hypothetical protein